MKDNWLVMEINGGYVHEFWQEEMNDMLDKVMALEDGDLANYIIFKQAFEGNVIPDRKDAVCVG